MTFNAVNRVNFLSNNKWQTPATIGLWFSSLCVIFMHFESLFAHFHQFWCFMGVRFQINDRCVNNEQFKVFAILDFACFCGCAFVPSFCTKI